jgi:CheY-like chemotaxis protein
MEQTEEQATADQPPVTVLLVEDDPGHTILIQKNLRRGGFPGNIVTVDNGGRAVDFILMQGEFAGTAHADPVVILLDLNLPVLDGYQVLRILKHEAATRHIPIIMLTTTDNPPEIKRCYDLGCNMYVTKPVEYEHFTEAIRSLGAFLAIVRLPAAALKAASSPSGSRGPVSCTVP